MYCITQENLDHLVSEPGGQIAGLLLMPFCARVQIPFLRPIFPLRRAERQRWVKRSGFSKAERNCPETAKVPFVEHHHAEKCAGHPKLEFKAIGRCLPSVAIRGFKKNVFFVHWSDLCEHGNRTVSLQLLYQWFRCQHSFPG